MQSKVEIIYNLDSQRHLEVTMTYDVLSPIRSGNRSQLTHTAVPTIFLDQRTVCDGLLMLLLVGYLVGLNTLSLDCWRLY